MMHHSGTKYLVCSVILVRSRCYEKISHRYEKISHRYEKIQAAAPELAGTSCPNAVVQTVG